MVSYATKPRFVRCPKCCQLLEESADVPLYRCGGCSTILRAKYYNGNGGNAASDEMLEKLQSHMSSSSGCSSNGSEKRAVPNSATRDPSEAENEEHTAVSHLNSSPSNIEQRFQEKHDSENEANESSNLVDEQRRSEESIETNIDSSLNEEVGNSPKAISKRGSDIKSLSSEGDIVDREVCIAHACGSDSPTTRTYQAYDGSVSSSDDGSRVRAANKYSALSRRTFRHRRVLHSTDDEESEGGNILGANGIGSDTEEQLDILPRRVYRHRRLLDSTDDEEKEDRVNDVLGATDTVDDAEERLTIDVLGANVTTTSFERHLDGRNQALVLPNGTFNSNGDDTVSDAEERLTIDVLGANVATTSFERHLQGRNQALVLPNGSFNSNGDELSSEAGSHAQRHDISFDMEEFYSVQNWPESEQVGPSRSTSRSSIFDIDPVVFPDDDSQARLDNLEHERTELLRKVSELRSQLNQKAKQNTQFSSTGHLQPLMHNLHSGLQIPPRFDSDPLGRATAKHYRSQKHQFSRIPYSGQSHCSCLHCIAARTCCHSGPCHSCAHSVCSSHSSEKSCCHNAKKGEYEFEKKQNQEKKPSTKRYCRPIAGGAPFVLCSKCFQLLQLPADFLISRSKLQKLKCSACSETLVFCFRGRARGTYPWTAKEEPHPPSEVTNSADGLQMGEFSSDRLQGDPISFTEEYELSFDNTNSTEVEPVLHGSTSKDEGAFVVTLHHLMGYSSARDLLNKPVPVPHSVGVGVQGRRTTSLDKHNGNGTSPSYMKKHEPDDSLKKMKTSTGRPPLHGIVKKGMMELNHGLENLMIRVHASRRTAPAP